MLNSAIGTLPASVMYFRRTASTNGNLGKGLTVTMGGADCFESGRAEQDCADSQEGKPPQELTFMEVGG